MDVFRLSMSLCSQTEDWLYTDEGNDASKSEYIKRTTELRKIGDPIGLRKWEDEHRNEAVAILKGTVVKYQMFVIECQGGEEKYDHIAEDELTKIKDSANSTDEWLVNSLSKQDKVPKTDNGAFSVGDCQKKLVRLQSAVIVI